MGEPIVRARPRIEELGPEVRARAEASLAAWRSPGDRAEEAASREQIDRDGGVTTADGVLHPTKDPAGAGPEFGLRPRSLREARGLSVEEVARASGIERPAVFKPEEGEGPEPDGGDAGAVRAGARGTDPGRVRAGGGRRPLRPPRNPRPPGDRGGRP